MSTEVLVRARGVARSFKNGSAHLRVLEHVTLEVRAGELALLVGPSGSGKTTLLSILAGLLRPDAGLVELAGERIDRQDERTLAALRRRTVGFVFQGFQLFSPLSARDNVAEVLALRNGMRIRAARNAADGLLAAVGLADRTMHAPAQLSAGQKQRVAIARAFAGAPRVVFADEPTALLDGAAGADVMALLRAHVTKQRCAIVVTHDLRLRRYADRVLSLTDGRLVEES